MIYFVATSVLLHAVIIIFLLGGQIKRGDRVIYRGFFYSGDDND